MARGQISDEDLSSGLKGLGGFGALGGAKVVKDSPFRDSRSEPKVVEVAKPVERPIAVKKAAVELAPPVAPDAKPTLAKPVPKPATIKKRKPDPQSAAIGRRVADTCTDRVTLQLSPEMRDRVDALAKELQRSRASRGERITANTVMRVAIRILIETFSIQPGMALSTEEELYEYLQRRFRATGR